MASPEKITEVNTPVLIPSYEPDSALVNTVQKLRAYGFRKIVIVDDGSRGHGQSIFASFVNMDGVDVIHHSQNQGKGAALKTGLRLISEKYPDSPGVVTVDGDGQHLVEDVAKVVEDGQMNSNALILGVRSFSGDVPFRSRIGNELTRLLTRVVYRVNVSDTQTGLRFLPRSIWKTLLTLDGERYEFEMNCLLLAKKLGVSIREVPISTVYLDGNSSSHFRPILDSLRVYAVFARFSLSGILSFLIDMGLFLILTVLTSKVFLAAIMARCVSGVFNFTVNKRAVFRRGSSGELEREAIWYLLLWAAINITSASLVSLADHLILVGLALVKIGIDISLFIVSFLVQKRIVFKR